MPIIKDADTCADPLNRREDVQVHWTYKNYDAFFSPQLILQKSNGYFQRKLSFSEVPGGFWGGGWLFPYRNPYNL